MSDHPLDVRSSPRRGVRRLPRDLPTTEFGGLHNAVFPAFGGDAAQGAGSNASSTSNAGTGTLKPRVSAATLRLLLPMAKSQVAPSTGVTGSSGSLEGSRPAGKVDSAPRLVRPSDSLSHLSSLVSTSVRIRSSVGLSQLGHPSPHVPTGQR